MQKVVFTFREGVSPEIQATILEQIRTWASVSGASRLNENARDPSLRRMYFMTVDDPAVINGNIYKLKQMPEVESAELPSVRGLI
jgi:hypothetical protein